MNLQKYWSRNNTLTNKLTALLLVIYLATLFWIIVLKLNISFSYKGTRNVNFIPFREPLLYNGRIDFNEIFLNILIFIPLGLYVGILFKKLSITRKIFSFFLVSFTCEAMQFVLRIGAFDITDIINNTFGGIIGLVLFKGSEKVFKNTHNAQKFINIIATIGTILIISLLLYLKINKLLMFRR
ncbi:VanZ family protein [Emticicia sp.]|uniref:VanZ family protein n=1 Tax=Emticicia sp. TaxID=1930953 RepID=UPI003752B2D5